MVRDILFCVEERGTRQATTLVGSHSQRTALGPERRLLVASSGFFPLGFVS